MPDLPEPLADRASASLAEENAGLRQELARERAASAELREVVAKLQAGTVAAQEAHAAALNLMEDAILAQEARRTSEERLRLIIESAKDYAIFTLNLKRCVNSWHSGAGAIFGFSEEEMLGEPGDILFVPEDRAAGAPVREAETALATGRAANERWHLRKDGSRFYGSGITMPLRDAGGAAVGFVKILRDLTETVRAQEALRESHRRTADILESISDAFYAVDAEFQFTYVNRKAEALWKRDRDTLIGRHYWSEFPQAVGSESHRMHLQVMEMRQPVSYETRSPILGEWVEVSIYPDQRGGLSVYFRDITARKRAEEALREAEERMRFATEAANIYAWEYDPETGRNAYASSTERVLGFALPEVVAEATALIHPEDREMVHERYEGALRENGRFDAEFRFLHPQTGEVVWQSSHGVFLNKPDGRPRFVGITQNITERKAAEEALRANEEQFRRAIEDAPVPVILQAEDGQVLQISDTWTELTGYTREDIPTFDAWLTRAYGLGADELREHAHRLFEGHARQLDVEMEISTREGKRRRWSFSASAPGALRDGRRFIVGMALDITERKAAEDALRHSQERLNVIFTQAPVGLSEVSLDGRFIRVNEEVCRITGRPHAEVLGMLVTEVTHPDDVLVSVKAIEQVLSGDVESIALDNRYLQPDGTVVWATSRLTRLDLSPGRPHSLLVVTVDMTARRHAEEALRSSEERFRAIVSQSTAGIGYADLEGRMTFVNERLAEILGAGPGDLAGKRMHELTGAKDAEENLCLLERSLIDETPFETEKRLVRDNGTVAWLNVTLSAIRDPDGDVRSMVAVVIDITARKEAEEALRESQERLRLIVENAREYAIFSMDLERRITSWNAGAQVILGYSQDEVAGRSGDMIFTSEDCEAGAPQREAEEALRENRAADERWHVRKDGSCFWGSGVMMAMRDAEDQAIGFVKIFRDQTEELRAKEALEKHREEIWAALQETERARAEAEAAGKAKDHFLAVLSHELRTPLTPVLMGVRTLSRDRSLSPQARDALEMIQRNVRLEAHLVDDLLDVTRISRGKLELLREPMDLHEAIAGAVEVSRPDIDAKGQQLSVELKASERRLSGDAKRLQQVFWNLLKNASKFTPEGGKLSIRSRNEPASADAPARIVVEVHDTGIGFEPEVGERIFAAFEQASQAVTREFGGLGLGLAISKATVDGHGGSIRAESAGPACGATFSVELPLG